MSKTRILSVFNVLKLVKEMKTMFENNKESA